MFTGIIETLGEIVGVEHEDTNIHYTVKSSITNELKIDQSVAHNGCCLTVVKLNGDTYVVTAIKESIDRTNMSEWKVGSKVNLERCMQLGARLDGHIVQGHVDTVGTCIKVEDLDGSWKYTFTYDDNQPTVQKGSITVNGVSLTVVDSEKGLFSVCIIPYTQEHTNFHTFQAGSLVNLEFDIIGKYVARLMEAKS
jgi:riboflavin synthase